MKAILLASTIMLSIGNISGADVLKFKCDSPDLNYLYRFQSETTLELYQNSQNEKEWRVYGATLEVEARKAGTSSTMEALNLPKMNGVLTKVESDFTRSPFYNLKFQSQDNKILVNLNLNYPSNLSSFIRDTDGYLYKAKCQVVAFNQCLFGDSLYNILENPEVTIVELGEVMAAIPSFDTPVNTRKSEVTYPSGQTFTIYRTFEDEVDGGNTYGKITDKNGETVAVIGDGDIYECKALK